MNLQGRNLSLRLKGDDVKLLHSELGELGFQIPNDELQSNFLVQEQKRQSNVSKPANKYAPPVLSML